MDLPEREWRMLLAISENEGADPKDISKKIDLDEDEGEYAVQLFDRYGWVILTFGQVSLTTEGREVVRQIKRELKRREDEDRIRRM
jgi:DNA-binding MarR family transcriptional regulator